MTDNAENDAPTVEVVGQTIIGKCPVCDDGIERPNKGLGRASVAAWRTRHTHVIPPAKQAGDVVWTDRMFNQARRDR